MSFQQRSSIRLVETATRCTDTDYAGVCQAVLSLTEISKRSVSTSSVLLPIACEPLSQMVEQFPIVTPGDLRTLAAVHTGASACAY